jgi:hypothetical protein
LTSLASNKWQPLVGHLHMEQAQLTFTCSLSPFPERRNPKTFSDWPPSATLQTR